jgi:hypothetical protein
MRRGCAADAPDLLQEVVVVQNGDLGHLAQAAPAQGPDPGVGLERHLHGAIEGPGLADAFRQVVVEGIAARVEDPGVLGVGDQQPGGTGADRLAQILNRRQSVRALEQGDDLVALHGGRGGVGRMAEDGGDHFVAGLTVRARGVVGLDDGHHVQDCR